jgi:hypothetical protein
MKKLVKYSLFLLFLSIVSCSENVRVSTLSGVDLFRTKIKSIKTEELSTKRNLLGNRFFLTYTRKNYKKVVIRFVWEKPNIRLSTFNLFFVVENKCYRCIYDKSDFSDMAINDTTFVRNINLESSKYLLMNSNEYLSGDFFNEVIKSKEVSFYATIQDLSLMSNPLLSSFVRRSNTIEITLKNESISHAKSSIFPHSPTLK